MINSICLSLINGKKYKRICFVSIVYILFCLSILFYLKSLRGCFGPFNYCASHKRLKLYFRLGFLLFISCVIFGASITLQIIARLHYINYLIFFIIYFIIFFSNQGTDFAHHGTYNSIIFILFFPFSTLLSFVIYLTLYFCFKIDIKKLLILFLFYIYVVIFFNLNTNCNHFYDGIGGIKLNNTYELNKCFITKPRICGYNLLSGLFDVNVFRKKGCFGYKDKKNIFLKYLDKNLQQYDNFSYPRTEHLNPGKAYKKLVKIIEKGILPVIDNNSKDKEVFVSFKGNKGRISINLKKNVTLIKEKRKLAKKYSVNFNNVYLIFFDGLSRNHFIRKLKKSTKIKHLTVSCNRENVIYKQKKRRIF